MSLSSEVEKQGQWLFRWRSYVPLAFLPVVAGAVAGMGTVGSAPFHKSWGVFCLAISMAGLAVRVLVVGFAAPNTSGRNTKSQVADSLNTSGCYSVVRHPLYLGNFLIALGAMMAPLVWWLPIVYTMAFWLYYERIMMAEEAFLSARFGTAFEFWANATPAFVPRPSQWRAPVLPFMLRTVLKREYTGTMVVVLLHCLLQAFGHLKIEGRLYFEPFWQILLGGGVAVYLTLLLLKKQTRILDYPYPIDYAGIVTA